MMYMLWFALYVGAPQLVHPCPEHNAASAAVAAVSESDEAAAAHHAHHSPAQTPDSDQNSDGDCCCPGPHCGTIAMDLGNTRPVAFPAPLAMDLAPSGTSTLAPANRVAHALPFATAPPAQSA